MMALTAFVADDERLARRRLLDLLEAIPQVSCVGEAAGAADTISGVNETTPDLLFLDIEMPDFTGLEVLEHLRHAPQVVFTTAYAQYATTAFDLNALDYLLKPFGIDRVRKTIARALSLTNTRAADSTVGGRSAMVPMPRVFVRERGRIVPIHTSRIQRVEAEGDYVALFVNGRRYVVNTRMKELDARLDPRRFMRIHRSHIVNFDFVQSLDTLDDSRLVVVLSDGTRVPASRAMSRALRRMAI